MHCVYDNPMMMRRELWRDGELAIAVTREALCYGVDMRGQLGLDYAILTARPWVDGAIVGNPEAMTTKPAEAGSEGQGA